jgi:hypothetical protein
MVIPSGEAPNKLHHPAYCLVDLEAKGKHVFFAMIPQPYLAL